MKTFLTAAALGVIAACAAQAHVASAPEPLRAAAPRVNAERIEAPRPSPATCYIRAKRTENGQRIEAVVDADRGVVADYDFVVTARSPGGASDITQAGPVDLEAGIRATVGAAEIPPGRFSARLVVTDADGEVCRFERNT